jgi:hypothetical protein
VIIAPLWKEMGANPLLTLAHLSQSKPSSAHIQNNHNTLYHHPPLNSGLNFLGDVLEFVDLFPPSPSVKMKPYLCSRLLHDFLVGITLRTPSQLEVTICDLKLANSLFLGTSLNLLTFFLANLPPKRNLVVGIVFRSPCFHWFFLPFLP